MILLKVGLSAKIETDLMHSLGEFVDSNDLNIHQAVERLLRNALGKEPKMENFSDEDLLAEIAKRGISTETEDLGSGKKATNRNRERTILEIVRRIFAETGVSANMADVLTEAGRLDMNRDTAIDIVDTLCMDGRIMRPTRDTLMPV